MLFGLKINDNIVLDIGNVFADVVSSVKLLGITIDLRLFSTNKWQNYVTKQTTRSLPALESKAI